MKYIFFLIILTFTLIAPPLAYSADTSDEDNLTSQGTYIFPKKGDIRVADQQEIEKLVKSHNADLLIINFWATWCPPCVAELPYFEEAHKSYKDRNVRIVGFNMDMDIYGDEWRDMALGTVKRKGATFLQFAPDIDMQESVPYFSSDWQGELPATFYFSKDGTKVGERLGAVEKEILFGDIEKILDKLPDEIPSNSDTVND